MDVDLCIDLIFFFPPSPPLGTAEDTANNKKKWYQAQVVINGMVTRENILFSHHANRQIFRITPM